MYTYLRGSGLLGILVLACPLFAAAPVFQRSDAIGVQLGGAIEYRLVAIGDVTRYSAQGLPTGVTIDSSTGLIRGTPKEVGRYPVSVSATNADGTSTAMLSISVVSPDAAPLIYAPLTVDAYNQPNQGGDTFNCALRATGSPTSYQVNGELPAGWTFNNGTLVGSCAKPGLVVVPVSAANTYGTGSAAVTVRVHPACTELQQTTGTLKAGDAFRVTLQFNRSVTFSGTAPYLEFHTYPDGATHRIPYVSGNGTSTFVFSYTVTTSDVPGDILLYKAVQPAVGAEVGGLTDSDGLALGISLPIQGAYVPTATIVSSQPASPVVSNSTGATAPTTSSPTPSTSPVVTTSPTPTGNQASAQVSGSVPPATTVTPATSATPATPVTSTTVTPTATSATAASTGGRLVNLSARGLVSAGDSSRSFIAGFVVSGSAAKTMLVRAVGPSLTSYGVQNALGNPRLRVLDNTGKAVAESDDWSGANVSTTASALGAFALPTGSRDAAVTVTLPPGTYSMEVQPNGGSGVALAELYDADPIATSAPLINISTRGYVSTGEGVLTVGFVVGGNASKRVLIRGVGPGLAAYGVAGTLVHPKLQVNQGSKVIAENDNWASADADVASAAKAVGAFALTQNSRDTATIVTLAPGAYTATVSSTDGNPGAALVEVYEF